MTARTITVTIPEMLFLQLEAAARTSAQSLDAVVSQSLTQALPTQLKALLPGELQDELAVMEQLSDDALHAIAYSTTPAERLIQMDALITLKQAGMLTPTQQHQLTLLRRDTEAVMVRKAHAFVLLKNRGQTLPPLDQLPVPSV